MTIKEAFIIIGIIFLSLTIFTACVYLFDYINKKIVIIKKKNKKTKEEIYIPLKKTKQKKYITFTKRKFDIILYHGIFWVDLSYVLAFMDKPQIAEALSVQAVTSIIGVFFVYCLKSFGEKKIGKEKEEYEDFNAEIYK